MHTSPASGSAQTCVLRYMHHTRMCISIHAIGSTGSGFDAGALCGRLKFQTGMLCACSKSPADARRILLDTSCSCLLLEASCSCLLVEAMDPAWRRCQICSMHDFHTHATESGEERGRDVGLRLRGRNACAIIWRVVSYVCYCQHHA